MSIYTLYIICAIQCECIGSTRQQLGIQFLANELIVAVICCSINWYILLIAHTILIIIPIVPHKAVAEVSKIGNL